ncbi:MULTISPECIES: hypothetical protein [unclassified Methylobacterium]|uniref:hypothetical protein n=1 Tax=unclassified Methylobacterium TaxID=2615210 RepID=UPI00135256AE|nr:hypothetical protein [Methylobacterium sp. 2A]MWV24994.1 hypothetical protein [Methylobacterium sp. 2A]
MPSAHLSEGGQAISSQAAQVANWRNRIEILRARIRNRLRSDPNAASQSVVFGGRGREARMQGSIGWST